MNVSRGGVPKRGVARALCGPLGLEGDGHDDPNHGGPARALCLYALVLYLALQREGHTSPVVAAKLAYKLIGLAMKESG